MSINKQIFLFIHFIVTILTILTILTTDNNMGETFDHLIIKSNIVFIVDWEAKNNSFDLKLDFPLQ